MRIVKGGLGRIPNRHLFIKMAILCLFCLFLCPAYPQQRKVVAEWNIADSELRYDDYFVTSTGLLLVSYGIDEAGAYTGVVEYVFLNLRNESKFKGSFELHSDQGVPFLEGAIDDIAYFTGYVGEKTFIASVKLKKNGSEKLVQLYFDTLSSVEIEGAEVCLSIWTSDGDESITATTQIYDKTLKKAGKTMIAHGVAPSIEPIRKGHPAFWIETDRIATPEGDTDITIRLVK